MSENKVDYVAYSQEHKMIVEAGIDSIERVLKGTNNAEKRSLLLCLDKYLDPYYGYKLTYFDEIITIIQQHLFLEESKEVKEDILQLLTDYAKGSLDYLADRIDNIDFELLGDALYALGNTYNNKYIPIFISYENHNNPMVQLAAREALLELSKLKR